MTTFQRIEKTWTSSRSDAIDGEGVADPLVQVAVHQSRRWRAG